MKALYRHQLHLSMFSELCRCYLQQYSLIISVWRATYSLGNSLVFWGDFLWVPLANNSIRHNPFPGLEVLFGDEWYLVGALSFPLFGDWIWMFKIYVYIYRSFYCIRITYDPSNRGPPCISSLTPIFPSSPSLILPFWLSSPCPSIVVYSISPLERSIPPHLSPTLYLISVVIWIVICLLKY